MTAFSKVGRKTWRQKVRARPSVELRAVRPRERRTVSWVGTEMASAPRKRGCWYRALDRDFSLPSGKTGVAKARAKLLGRLCRGRGAVALLVEIIGPIEFEDEVAIDRRRIARRIVG